MLDQAGIDRLRHSDVPPGSHLIDGKAEPSASGRTLDVVSPVDGSKLTTIADGGAPDIERAVAAARSAFERGVWRNEAPAASKRIMHRLADLIGEHALELAVLGVRDNGTEIGMAYRAEPWSAEATIRYYAETVDKTYGEIAPTPEGVLGLIHREPVGVVGAIVPWNFPLMIGAWKLGPALAAGNSVVIKPAVTASLSLIRLCELGLEAGIPPGVLNVVTGRGSSVGEALSLSMDVDVLVFTGSGPVGRRIMENASRSNLKRVYLELGGKSANIVFADAPDLAAAARVSAGAVFRNSGQVCVAASRLLVERSIHRDFVADLAAVAGSLKVGNPLSLESDIGAVNNEDQLAGNLRAVETARTEGGDVVLGGGRILEDTGGFYMEPTIVTGVERHHDLARKEVFGPVLAVTPFDSEAEAVSLANSTDYGLSGAVWTSNLSRAHRMVRAIRSGVVQVNCYGAIDVTCPLGGMKQSGNGYDKSLHALDKYSNLKTAWLQL